jgi:hypothetical protein
MMGNIFPARGHNSTIRPFHQNRIEMMPEEGMLQIEFKKARVPVNRIFSNIFWKVFHYGRTRLCSKQ